MMDDLSITQVENWYLGIRGQVDHITFSFYICFIFLTKFQLKYQPLIWNWYDMTDMKLIWLCNWILLSEEERFGKKMEYFDNAKSSFILVFLRPCIHCSIISSNSSWCCNVVAPQQVLELGFVGSRLGGFEIWSSFLGGFSLIRDN